jgi:hypothetical protein
MAVVHYGMRKIVAFINEQLIKKEIVTEILDIFSRFNLKSYNMAESKSISMLKVKEEKKMVGSLRS